MSAYITIRIRETGQVTEMVPDVARAMLASGVAERVDTKTAARPESAMREPAAERAVAPAQAGPTKKSRFGR